MKHPDTAQNFDEDTEAFATATERSLMLSGKNTQLRIIIKPFAAGNAPSPFQFNCTIKKTGKILEKGTLDKMLSFEITLPNKKIEKCALRADNGKIVFYHYEPAYRGHPQFYLRFDDKTNEWFVENLTGKNEKITDGLSITDFPCEQFLCGQAWQENMVVPEVVAAVKSPSKIRFVEWNNFYTGSGIVGEMRTLHQELLTYVKKKSFVKEHPALFSEHEKDWGKTFQHRTDGKTPIWFIGDVHGDLFALKTLTDFAHRHDHDSSTPGALPASAPTQLFFLGDFIDRGEQSAEVMAWIMGNAAGARFGGKEFTLMAVLGNHDAGLRFDDTHKEFYSTVHPSEFDYELNDNPAAIPFGKAVLDFFAKLPAMVLLDETLMVVHGGVPHPDFHAHCATRESLHQHEVLKEFYWQRLHDTARRKMRGALGLSQIGIDDFNDFIEKLASPELYGFSPKIVVRGHDHVEHNFWEHQNYTQCNVVTINAMTIQPRRSPTVPQNLAMARWCPDNPLELTVFRFEIPERIVWTVRGDSALKSIIHPDFFERKHER